MLDFHDLKFLAALVAGAGVCLCLALLAVVMLYLTTSGDKIEPDDGFKAIGSILAVLIVLLPLYVWGQS